jgi:hypothetical protein
MMGHLKSDQGQLFYEFCVSDAHAQVRTSATIERLRIVASLTLAHAFGSTMNVEEARQLDLMGSFNISPRFPTMRSTYTRSFQYSLTSYLRTSSTQVVSRPCRGMSRL